MKFFLKRKLKENTKIIFEEAIVAANAILRGGYEFVGDVTHQQLKNRWQRVEDDKVDRWKSMTVSGFAFLDSPLTVSFVQNKILYPILETYIPPEVNGKIILVEQCHALFQYNDAEKSSPYRPEAEISVIWEEIGPDIIGEKAFRNQHETASHSGRFSFIKKPVGEISQNLEDFIFGDRNFRTRREQAVDKYLAKQK